MSVLSRYQFTLKIDLVAPYLQSGLALPWLGFDAAPLINQNGTLAVSGDQIEGYLRHIMLINGGCLSDINNWFGVGGIDIDADDLSIDPKLETAQALGGTRARLKIFDLAGPEAPAQYLAYHRIALAQETGSAKQGSWQVIAQPCAPGSEISFEGQGRLFAGDVDEAERLLAWINAGLEMVPAIGAVKSSGFGRLKSAKAESSLIGLPLAPSANIQQTANLLQAFGMGLRLNAPLLVDHIFHSGNVQDGSEIIPGDVVKGAIADMLAMGGELENYSDLLSAVTIRHARPAEGQAVPLPPAPLSLGFSSSGGVDMLAEPDMTEPLEFQRDWKNSQREQVCTQFYLPGNLPRHVRTRTAISLGDNVPEPAKLFSQRCVATLNTVWHTALILPEDTDEQLQAKLGALAAFLKGQGIARIGKTAVEAGCTTSLFTTAGLVRNGGTVRITLQTPAWLLSPGSLAKDGADLFEAYSHYFRDRLNCTLKDFAALQYWSGGPRFVGRKSSRSDGYYPWLMTHAGSVFILANVDEDKLLAALRCGLPAAENRTWKDCPFLPQNGYGEIVAGDDDLNRIRDINHV
jgi:hypothetical protein